MFKSRSNRQMVFFFVAVGVLMLAGVFARPALAGGSGGSAVAPARPSDYYLRGDAVNYSGGPTYFLSYGGDVWGSWTFNSYVDNGTAVRGWCPNGYDCWGLYGISNYGIGTVSDGTWGSLSRGSIGSYGVGYGSTSVGGWFASTASNGWALVTGFDGRVGDAYIAGSIVADNYYAYVLAADGSVRKMHTTQSTRNIASDQGSAQLVNGRAVVAIDGLYSESVSLTSDYQVFVTPGSADTAGLAVVNKTATSFEVRELSKGKGNFKFDWRIDAVRKGSENNRMEIATKLPPSDAGKGLDLQNVLNKMDGAKNSLTNMPQK